MFQRYAVIFGLIFGYFTSSLVISHAQNLYYYGDGSSAPIPYKPFEQSQKIITGQNSFSEAQIRRLLKENGFNRIDRLWLDDRGIWRGIIQVHDKNRIVAIDYLGHIAIDDLSVGASND